MSYAERDIGTEDLKITELVRYLQEDKFLIPTFQRDFVWRPEQVLALWDSMFRFYPIGSILYWETGSYLHTHRRLGGFTFPHDEPTVRKFREWKYILDGQQRTTAIFIAMIGGKGRVEDDAEFDYSLYFDATCGTFFFPNRIERHRQELKRGGASDRFLVRVADVPGWRLSHFREFSAQPGYGPDVEHNLDQLQRMFTDYKLPLIRIRGVDVDEVCDIFERINQEGRKLNTVDIIIARTYRVGDPISGADDFYLRDRLDAVKDVLVEQGSRWQDVDDLTLLQMVGLCLRKQTANDRNPYGITAEALSHLTADDFEQTWPACQRAILDTLKFLSDQRVHGPNLLPYTYLALPLCYHFYRNPRPNRDLARQWFWRNVFRPTPLNNASEVYHHCEGFFACLERGERAIPDPLTLPTRRLIRASYQYNNALSRAVLAFLAYQSPRDFSDAHADVLDNVYLDLRHTPNLHHIFPRSFLARHKQSLHGGYSIDSLMNICFLRSLTNTRIADRNPLEYFKDYAALPGFDQVLESHLIPREYVERGELRPEDYGKFLQARARKLATRLRDDLPAVQVTVE